MKKLWPFYVKHNLKIGLILTLLGLWLAFFPPGQNPHLTFYYQSFDLVQLKEKNDNLSIFFKGVDISKTKQNLKLYAFTIVNDGNSDIKVGDYDPDYPFGIKVTGGFITGCALKSEKDEYVSKRLCPDTVTDSTQYLFNKIIIGKGQRIHVELTVIHNGNVAPKVTAVGRIANANIDLRDGKEDKRFDWWGLIQLIAGLFLFLGGFYLVGRSIELLVKWIIAFVRKSQVKKRLGIKYDGHQKTHRAIVELYAVLGKEDFVQILSLLKDAPKLNEQAEIEFGNKTTVERYKKLVEQKKVDEKDGYKEKYKSDLLRVIKLLEEAELIEQSEDHKLIVQQEFLAEIDTALARFKQA